MNNNGVNETIRSYIANNILYNNKGFPYSDDTSFLENGIIDSMNIMELVLFLEVNLRFLWPTRISHRTTLIR